MNHRRIQLSGAELHFVEEGDGPLIVLLHGYPEFWYSWRNQIPALARAGFRVIAPDLRGYNESSKPAEVDAYRVSRLVQDIVELIEREAQEPCVLVGHDWGGVVAWFVAMTRPELLRKLVILNSPHPVPYARELRRSREQKLRAMYQILFAAPIVGPLFLRFSLFLMRFAGRFTHEDLAEMRAAWRRPGVMRSMRNYYRALLRSRQELRALVRPIELPTLLIWGIHDPVFIRETTENFAEYVPKLRVERVPRAGHFVQTDAAEKVTELLIEFAR